MLKYEKDTLTDIKTVLKYVGRAIEKLGLQQLPVSQVRKKHIRSILDQCSINQDNRARTNPEKLKKAPVPWSADRQNKYRAFYCEKYSEVAVEWANRLYPFICRGFAIFSKQPKPAFIQ